MEVIKSNEAIIGQNISKCQTFEYSFGDKDIDLGIAIIKGRHPETGYCTNLISKELVYVIDGFGKICFKNKIVNFKQGDAILIENGEMYYWDTDYCKVALTCTPAFNIEQYKFVEDEKVKKFFKNKRR